MITTEHQWEVSISMYFICIFLSYFFFGSKDNLFTTTPCEVLDEWSPQRLMFNTVFHQTNWEGDVRVWPDTHTLGPCKDLSYSNTLWQCDVMTQMWCSSAMIDADSVCTCWPGWKHIFMFISPSLCLYILYIVRVKGEMILQPKYPSPSIIYCFVQLILDFEGLRHLTAHAGPRWMQSCRSTWTRQ